MNLCRKMNLNQQTVKLFNLMKKTQDKSYLGNQILSAAVVDSLFYSDWWSSLLPSLEDLLQNSSSLLGKIVTKIEKLGPSREEKLGWCMKLTEKLMEMSMSKLNQDENGTKSTIQKIVLFFFFHFSFDIFFLFFQY